MVEVLISLFSNVVMQMLAVLFHFLCARAIKNLGRTAGGVHIRNIVGNHEQMLLMSSATSSFVSSTAAAFASNTGAFYPPLASVVGNSDSYRSQYLAATTLEGSSTVTSLSACLSGLLGSSKVMSSMQLWRRSSPS